MEVSVAYIISDVKVCIDELDLNESEFLSGEDNVSLEAVIESKIDDALRFVNVNADLSYIDPTVTSVPCANVNGVVRLLLPEEFVRLCYVKVDGWYRSVTDTILFSDKEYATLKNPITTGYPDNPKAALVISGQQKALELYTAPKSSGNEVDVAYAYIGVTKPENGVYDISSKVYRGVIYYAAGLTLLSFKDEHADTLMNQAIQIIGAK